MMDSSYGYHGFIYSELQTPRYDESCHIKPCSSTIKTSATCSFSLSSSIFQLASYASSLPSSRTAPFPLWLLACP